MKKIGLIILSIITMTACTTRYASNGEHIYLRSKNGVMVNVPPPLTSEYISHFYDLPPQTQNAAVSIIPPDMGIKREG